MPRLGGVANKLGNRFEGVWTVGVLLDLVGGAYRSVAVEPIGDEASGIEFVAVNSAGIEEFFSIKRQHSEGHWTASRLHQNGVIQDLIAKAGAEGLGVFCSGTSATGLDELIASAKGSDSFEIFERRIRQSDNLEHDLNTHVNTSFDGDTRAAYKAFRRLRVETENEARLVNNVERQIKLQFRMQNGTNVDPHLVRLLIGDFVLDRAEMGSAITQIALLSFLEAKEIHLSRLIGDATILASIERCNARYLKAAHAHLINGQPIDRADSLWALDELVVEGHSVSIEGEAGSGKSCIAAQVVKILKDRDVPCLALSLDGLVDSDSTAERLGQQRGLDYSPTATLGEYAGTARSVLVLDQVDSLSRASGRRRPGRDALNEMLAETRDYPEMRVLFACRSFDIQHDPEIRALEERTERLVRIEVSDLSDEEIQEAIAAAGISEPVLSEEQLRILGRPLHLSLFIDASTGGRVDFAAAGELFDAFWERKGLEVDEKTAMYPSAWYAANLTLCDQLSRRERAFVPEYAMGAHLHTVREMSSASVVRIDDGEVQYFHESFFDYAFARSLLATGKDLVPWLIADEQHLFRRSQVRQVLAFLRRHPSDRAHYEQTLREVLQASEIRRHIKVLVLDWVAALPDPSEAEWHIVEQLEPTLGDHIWRVVANSIPWFDLLDQLGRWDNWLDAEHEMPDRAVALMSLPDILDSRTERVGSLLVAHRDESLEWRRRLVALVRSRPALLKPELRNLIVELLSDGTFDEHPSDLGADVGFWTTLHLLNEDDPEFVAHLLGVWLDRQIHVACARDPADPFWSGSPLVRYDDFSNDAIQECATRVPSAFIRAVLPRFVELDQLVPHHGLRGPDPDGMPDRFFREEIIRALRALAREAPSQLDSITSDVIGSDFPRTKWTASALLDAWTESPVRYAERIFDVLFDRAELWLEPEGPGWVGRLDSYVEVSRRALAAASPHCSDGAFRKVETAILHKDFDWERQADLAGFTELELLLSLPANRLNPRSIERVAELSNRFPDVTGVPAERSLEPTNEIQPVPSPLSLQGAGPYSDARWLTTMRRFRDPRPVFTDGQFVGGSYMLARDLEEATRGEPQRFVELAGQMNAEYEAVYFEAILRGLTGDETGRGLVDQSPHVFSVLRHIRDTGVRIRGGEATRAISALASTDLPSDLVDMVRDVAVSDPDPAADDWHGLGSWRSPVDQAINSARGAAAQSIAALLAANATRWDTLRPAVEQLVGDRVLAVRTTAVQCLSAILDTHQDDALALFSQLAQGAESILGTIHVERFIHNAIFRDYTGTRPILLAMLKSDYPETVTVAARQVAVAALYVGSEEARDDERSLQAMGANARSATASIYTVNLNNDSVSDTCEARLLQLISDEDVDVRNAAADWMRLLTPNEIAKRGALIGACAASGSLAGELATLARRLVDATVPLPIEFCALAEAVLAEDSTRIGGAFHLPQVAVRLYEQHQNSAPADRLRLLDLIDELVWLGAHGIDDELRRQYER